MNVALPLTNRTVLRPVVETLAGSAELSNQGHSGHEQRATLLSHALTVKRAAIFCLKQSVNLMAGSLSIPMPMWWVRRMRSSGSPAFWAAGCP
jgi:hypothetical protein